MGLCDDDFSRRTTHFSWSIGLRPSDCRRWATRASLPRIFASLGLNAVLCCFHSRVSDDLPILQQSEVNRTKVMNEIRKAATQISPLWRKSIWTRWDNNEIGTKGRVNLLGASDKLELMLSGVVGGRWCHALMVRLHPVPITQRRIIQ